MPDHEVELRVYHADVCYYAEEGYAEGLLLLVSVVAAVSGVAPVAFGAVVEKSSEKG